MSEACSAERLNYIVPRHWGVENRLHWAPDVTGSEDQAPNRKGHCAANLALLRKLAQSEGSEWSLRGNLKRAGWDDGFLLNILPQFPRIRMR